MSRQKIILLGLIIFVVVVALTFYRPAREHTTEQSTIPIPASMSQQESLIEGESAKDFITYDVLRQSAFPAGGTSMDILVSPNATKE